jgi:hypothetical protein
MPEPSQFDLDFRPSTYWAGPARATANIKGTMRRKMVGRGRDVPAELLAPSLDDDVRAEISGWHPAFMGGEYLPDHDEGEVTIARIEMESTTGDVIDVRARPIADGIGYRVVDEYETAFTCRPTTSTKPLTMGELVGLIDSINDGERTGLTNSLRDYQVEGEVAVEEAATFVQVASDFYPQLTAWFEAEAAEWLKRQRSS